MSYGVPENAPEKNRVLKIQKNNIAHLILGMKALRAYHQCINYRFTLNAMLLIHAL